MTLFYYGTMVMEGMIAVFLLWGKSLGGYLLLLYYGAEAGIEYLISRVGKGRSMDNIYLKWELARYVALLGIALILTYSQTRYKKPF